MNIKVEMSKDAIVMVNHTAQVNFSSAVDMLMGINLVLGTNYYFINKRVSYTDSNGKQHDAYANAKA